MLILICTQSAYRPYQRFSGVTDYTKPVDNLNQITSLVKSHEMWLLPFPATDPGG
ncbi:MAG: hypothetical protein IPH59_02925 [bacterium]|nr:hypothetical protein [bacterium]